MSSRPPLSPQDREWLAAEHALGLLEGDELAEARRLEDADPSFAAQVARWSIRLSPLLDEVPSADPPERLFARIASRLPSNDNVAGLRQRVRRWQMASGGLTAIAASLALILLTQPNASPPVVAPPQSRPPMVAVLEGGPNRLVASWDGGKNVMIVPAVVSDAGRGHSHELWMIPKDGKPRSMGVMPAKPMHLTVEPETAVMLAEGATFAVSVEPAGGSPTGLPTGPVIASGRLERA